MGEPNDERNFSLGETLRQHPLIAAQVQLLARQLSHKGFTSELPEKGPDRGSRTGRARVEVTDLADPLGMKQVAERTELLRLDQLGVVPDVLGLVGLGRIDKTLGVCGPN